MQGLMQRYPLLISSLIVHAARHRGGAEVVSNLGGASLHRTTYAEVERRSRRLARVLAKLGIGFGDRVATLAWNDYRHLELYYGVSGMGAVCHTVNPRLSADDISFIMDDARDCVIFADPSFAALLTEIAPSVNSFVRAVVLLTDEAGMPEVALPPGMRLHAYETLMAEADEDYVWLEFDENTASALCYTSGTTGRPKGVLYSHRAAMLHTYATNSPDLFGIRAVDRVLPASSMYHACAWGLPYCATMVGATLILPGRHLDGASLYRVIESERVTLTAGVPTIWLGLLAHLESSGARLTQLKRVLVAGSALPQLIIEAFSPMGVNVEQGWGMTETSPIVTYNAPTPASAALTGEDAMRQRLKQGRAACGTDMKIVDAEGQELPWDGKAFGDFLVRGHWVCREYINRGAEGAADADGWFRTGDVCTIDADGCAEIVDRSKDVIKSGGEWISSIALENIAVSHPAVAEAAIVAARHPKWQERPLLLVVPRAGAKIDKDELLEVFAGKVAK
ncbi:MAG: long-chain-fatty-acid--CoA ligase, partial [Roseiarcus sp.]|uniref:long-chain-fatty-acid--CoA ligase n=1 Tax=Roseiarcus sp. TaxID=1969460 RepID=UPI003C571047